MKTNKKAAAAEWKKFEATVVAAYSWIERDEYRSSIEMRINFLELEGVALAKQLLKEYPRDIVKYVMGYGRP